MKSGEKRLTCDVFEASDTKSSKKGRLVTYLKLLTRIPALFMTSLIQAAGQEMAALLSYIRDL